jgi:hypothetical protein
LTDFRFGAGCGYLDHDQTNTLHVGGNVSLPWRTYASTDVYYGSGFSNGNPPPSHLPGHTTFDLVFGKNFGERWTASVTALDVANLRVLLDNSYTFGGTHYNLPRQIYAQERGRDAVRFQIRGGWQSRHGGRAVHEDGVMETPIEISRGAGCTKCGAPAYNAARINQPSGRTTNGKICMALIESTLNETDWKDVSRGVAF